MLEHERIEIERDVFQILAGVVVIAVLAWLGLELGGLAIAALVLLGFMTVAIARNSKSAGPLRFLYRLERKNIGFGSGAIWLGIGVLLYLLFVHSEPYLLMLLFATMISDSLATISGITLKGPLLPYSRRKTIVGSAFYFTSMLAFGYFAVGVMAIVFSLLATFVESLDIKIDDNLLVPVALIVLFLIVAR
ncbi:MAG: hypothetical protein ACP5MK_03335 [Candidatus Micrarchaeia archaeon]